MTWTTNQSGLVTLTFALLTLKVVSESRMTWATSVPILFIHSFIHSVPIHPRPLCSCTAPLHLTELCRPILSDAEHRHLRSAFTRRPIVPNYGDCSFSVHGPSVWNSLPNNLRLSDMLLETFRSRPKAFLFGHWSLDSPIAAVREFGLYK